MTGLARAFFFAGARSLVASQWEIADRTTARLMARFYENLHRGLSKGGNLRQTKIDMIRNENLPPKDWAGFVLLGEAGGAVGFEYSTSNLRILSTAAIAYREARRPTRPAILQTPRPCSIRESSPVRAG